MRLQLLPRVVLVGLSFKASVPVDRLIHGFYCCIDPRKYSRDQFSSLSRLFGDLPFGAGFVDNAYSKNDTPMMVESFITFSGGLALRELLPTCAWFQRLPRKGMIHVATFRSGARLQADCEGDLRIRFNCGEHVRLATKGFRSTSPKVGICRRSRQSWARSPTFQRSDYLHVAHPKANRQDCVGPVACAIPFL